MQYIMMEWLRCPITNTQLKLQVISEFEKKYEKESITEVKEGIFFSETGLVFPIIDGIPRMMLEAMDDYAAFLQQHLPNFKQTKSKTEVTFTELLAYCRNKNKRTKISFEKEWDLLSREKNDKIWNTNAHGLLNIFLKETGKSIADFANKHVLDAGCGHGIMTAAIASVSGIAIGAELSKAVEAAYAYNTAANAWYVQADLEFLPFANGVFDTLYSSGVIHHTPDTKKALLQIETKVKTGGSICLWLYHPQKNLLHQCFLLSRRIFKLLPVALAVFLIRYIISPPVLIVKKIVGRKKINYRENSIDMLDMFSPEFRHEIKHEEAAKWLQELGYEKSSITTTDQYGFSIMANKGFKPYFNECISLFKLHLQGK